jgi:Cu/Ag efflux protein CusF
MKNDILLSALVSLLIFSACGEKAANVKTSTPQPSPTIPVSNGVSDAGLNKPQPPSAISPTPITTPSTSKNGDYPGKGVVTKINLNLGSVEMDHEEIKGVMPAMTMEFYVSEKALLTGLKVGDKVDFVLRYKDHTETIVSIKKPK